MIGLDVYLMPNIVALVFIQHNFMNELHSSVSMLFAWSVINLNLRFFSEHKLIVSFTKKTAINYYSHFIFFHAFLLFLYLFEKKFNSFTIKL